MFKHIWIPSAWTVLRWRSIACACWCPDNALADAHQGACEYCRFAEVMEQLDAARDELLDDDDWLVGPVKYVKGVEKRLRHKLLLRDPWRFDSVF